MSFGQVCLGNFGETMGWDQIYFDVSRVQFGYRVEVDLDCLDCKYALVALIYSVKKKGEGEGRVLYKI